MIRVLVGALLAASISAATMAWPSPSGAAPQSQAEALSPASAAAVERVRLAIQQAEADLMRASTDDAPEARLIEMGRLDRAARAALMREPWHLLDPSERSRARSQAYRYVREVDVRNQTALLALPPPASGWWSPDEVGFEASSAAFLVIQHADLATRQRFLPALEREAMAERIPGEQFAAMSDRADVELGKPQRFGTQAVCEAGRFVVAPISDEESLDERRARLKMQAFAEFEAQVAAMPPC